MNQNATAGTNRTGAAAAPGRTQAMLAGVEEFLTTSQGSAYDVAQVRVAYAREAEPVGTIPLPPTLTGKIKTAVQAVAGDHPVLFMDKLGERLAFERSGTRFYETLVSKYDAYDSFSGGPTREDLEHIQQEEFRHFTHLHAAIEQLGGDPTAVTPSADLQATAAKGIMQVITDPRTTLLQSLEAILVAELTDNACWEARAMEEEHLLKVRAWVAAGQGRAAEGGSNRGR